MHPESQWLNVQDVADLLQIKSETVRRWIRRNELPVLELGGPRAGYRIRQDDLDHFIWQRYRVQNQDDAERAHHADLPHATGNAAPVRVRASTEQHGDSEHRVSVNGRQRVSGQVADEPYSSLMQRIPGMTYVTRVDPSTEEGIRRRIAYIGAEFTRRLGPLAGQLRERNQTWWEVVHHDDRGRVQAARRHSLLSGERLSIEYRIVPPDGEPIWVRDEAVCGEESSDGDIVWQGIVVDITERKNVEDALRARVQQQQVVAELGEHALQWTDLPTLLNEAVEYISQTLRAEHVKLLELQPGGKVFLLRAGVGWRSSWIGKREISAGPDTQAGYTLSSNEPVIVRDLLTEARFTGPSVLHDCGVRSGLSVIIGGRGKPYGVLSAHSISLREFTADDVAFLQAIANVLAAAVIAANQTPGSGRWLSIRDIADTLRVKDETVRRWIRRGELPVIDLGSSRAGYRVHPADLEYFINERYMKL